MERFLIDSDEVFKAITDTYIGLFGDKKPSSEELAVLIFMKVLADKISVLDVQKIEGIDLGKGDGKVFPDKQGE